MEKANRDNLKHLPLGYEAIAVQIIHIESPLQFLNAVDIIINIIE